MRRMAGVQFVGVPPDGARRIGLTDRRSGRMWEVVVEPFELASTVVTRGMWHDVVGDMDARADDSDLPAVEVSWREAVVFCNELSERHGLAPAYRVDRPAAAPPGRWVPHDRPAPDSWSVTWDQSADGYRLPTEAEWQVACEAGTSGPRYGVLDEIGWYAANSAGRLRPVGGKEPNGWGLFDMLGGVWEWCWDLFDRDTYGAYRIIRGGGWADEHWSCRAGVRRKTPPTARLDDIGFRLARNSAPAALGHQRPR